MGQRVPAARALRARCRLLAAAAGPRWRRGHLSVQLALARPHFIRWRALFAPHGLRWHSVAGALTLHPRRAPLTHAHFSMPLCLPARPLLQLHEQNELVWNDGVAPETCIDFDVPHWSSLQGLVWWLGGLGFFASVYTFASSTSHPSNKISVSWEWRARTGSAALAAADGRHGGRAVCRARLGALTVRLPSVCLYPAQWLAFAGVAGPAREHKNHGAGRVRARQVLGIPHRCSRRAPVIPRR